MSRVVVVTGASAGVGRAVAREFAARGDRVALVARGEAGLKAAVGWSVYITSSDFWDRTLQNWQSEFLAVGSMAVLSIYLRQRGSPESKRVGDPHDATADGG